MRTLGAESLVEREQVVSFFFELGQAYLSARFYGKDEPRAAMDFAIRRLRTLDAARTFAFAEATTHFKRDDKLDVERVEVVPGAYAPQAVVTLRKAGEATRMVMQLRLEWGDWYVAELQTIGAPG